ncbi:MAG TPA: c-type cytochrome [Vicinamibacterales bacterium]|nr:c-type cytochrome [Vicinamibacterales bacterium]
MRMTRAAVLLVAAVNTTILVAAQEPPATPAQTRPTGQGRGGAQPIREFLGLGRPPDPQVAARGEKLYAAACAFCHGPDARGAQAPSLLRSEIVLHDDKGEVIGPVIRNGRPDKGMPAMPTITPVQIAEIAEYLHLLVERAANRGLYGTLYANNILTGDPKTGEAFFKGAGRCSTCHSATGDLAHVGTTYQGTALQNRWLWPSGSRGSARPAQATVTLPSGERVVGLIRRIDDFDVSMIDASGAYRSWPRDRVKVDIADPLEAHRLLLATYSDADIHNVTAYLATLK